MFEERIELSRELPHRLLRPARLPIPPLERTLGCLGAHSKLRVMKTMMLLASLLGALTTGDADAHAELRLGVGADFWADRGPYYSLRGNWTDGRNQFLIDVHLSIDGEVNEFLSLGARTGFFLAVPSITPGVPLDFEVRITPIRKLYIEALVGPWLLIDDPAPIRLHASFGFGYRGRGFQIGLEASYLAPSPMLGVRIGFPI